MSTAHFIAYDYSLPKINLRTMKTFHVGNTTIEFETGFMIETAYYDNEGFIKKEYIYEISLEADNSCMESLKQYLIENMKNSSELEIWTIRLGGDYTKHYKNKVRVKGLSPEENAMVNDDVDWYKENYVIPKRRDITIEELSIEDILFILNNLSVCLIIKKQCCTK